jgi:hypothetical protein
MQPLLILQDDGSGAGGLLFMIVYLGILLTTFAGMWATFAKAGEPGWAILIPIYNLIVLLKVADKPLWWIILFFIPVVNLIVAIATAISLANNFGKGAGFGIGLAFLPFIFYPLLGFGDAQYQGG